MLGSWLEHPDIAASSAFSGPPLSPEYLLSDTRPRSAPTTPGEGDAHSSETLRYELSARLDPARHTVSGDGTITWRNTSERPVQELYVHLYLNAFKNDRSLYARTKGGGTRWNAAPGQPGRTDVERFFVREMNAELWPKDATTQGDPDDETDIRVPLSRPVEPGERLTIDVRFTSVLPELSLRTGYAGSFHMVAQWFPKLALLARDGHFKHFAFHRFAEFYAEFASYEVTLDVPEGVIVGAVGRKTNEIHEGGRVKQTYEEDRVHDFAFAAWEGFAEKTSTTEDGIALRCLYPPEQERSAATELEIARFGLEYMGRAYGAYPYKTLTIIHPPEWAPEAGGMEYPTLITTGGAWYLPWHPGRLTESVTLHELAHQWFYGIVATDEHAHPFLDEGLSTFAELDAMEARFPNASAAVPVLNASLSMPSVHRHQALDAPRTTPIAQPAPAFESAGQYASLVYSRTAILLYTLGGAYGMDNLRRALASYARHYRFAHPAPEDFERVIAEHLGGAAAKALHTGLYEGGWLDFTAELISSGSVRTAHITREGSLALPVSIDLTGEDGQTTRIRWDAESTSIDIAYPGSSPLARIVVDPEHKILLDETFLNNAASHSPNTLSPRLFERLGFTAQLALHLLSP